MGRYNDDDDFDWSSYNYGYNSGEDEEEEGFDDNSHPYGEEHDSDPNSDDNDEQEQEKNDGKDEDVEVKGKGEANNASSKGVDVNKMRATARGLELPSGGPVKHLTCPGCNQKSLFKEKIMATGVRSVVYYFGGMFGLIPTHNAPKVVRYLCLNPVCTLYYPRARKKLFINKVGDLKPEAEKGFFTIIR